MNLLSILLVRDLIVQAFHVHWLRDMPVYVARLDAGQHAMLTYRN